MPQSPQRMTIHPPDNHGRPTIGNSSISIFVNPVASPNAIADAAELNREVQNLTKIEDTRVLEIQDKDFSNNVANGPYLCNLRDASTINTDGEFVSNVLATSPGLRDSHYVSPRPVSKSPRLDGPTFLPPSQTPNSLGVNSAHNDHIFYNNTVSTKPPTSLRVHNDERPKTSSPYQNGRVHSQSPSPVRSSSSQILGPIGGVGSPDQECKAVSRVMGQAQCQTAVTINNRTRRRFEEPNKLDLRIQLTASARQRALSPTFPNVLQKSESWHQLVREQMHQAKQAPPAPSPSLPKIARAKSSHSLNQYKQYEATLQPDASLANKKITVSQYLSKKAKHSLSNKSRHKSLGNIATFDDEIEDVDEAFESIFQENNRKRNSK
ncbi:unnamed protein product [Nesidiocoris tenuis]|uniref:Uncharacterized protein n=1 Tax=Nesidiocoris tenuis TaxID=355587 RepID=A0A6H5HP51_9HEMI|nr:unnamed protein product [Nesidiocoris tenuis]